MRSPENDTSCPLSIVARPKTQLSGDLGVEQVDATHGMEAAVKVGPAADSYTGGVQGVARLLSFTRHLGLMERQQSGDIGIAQVNRALAFKPAQLHATRGFQATAVKGEVLLVYTFNMGAFACEAPGDIPRRAGQSGSQWSSRSGPSLS